MTHAAPPPDAVAVWDRTLWRGEPAWASSCGSVRAVISESRARLIHLGSADGQVNLLNAPWPQVLPDREHPWPNQGGHRFWLGPQHRWVWPPPAEWEYSGARSVAVHAGVLTLQHAHFDAAYPAITREYAWQGSRLRCTARWVDDGRRHFGLHVVAVDVPVALTARLESRPGAPAGVVAARMIDPEPPLQLPHPALTIHHGQATVVSGVQRVKFGFVPQALEVARPGGWSLIVHPGPASEPAGEPPDAGLLSQVWVGDAACDLAELEQLTPPLRGDAFGRCSSTIFIEATPPARQSPVHAQPAPIAHHG